MGKSVGSGAMWLVQGVAVLAAAVVVALLAATSAWASSPSGVSVQFYKSTSPGSAQQVATTKAGEKVGYQVSFTATSALSGATRRMTRSPSPRRPAPSSPPVTSTASPTTPPASATRCSTT